MAVEKGIDICICTFNRAEYLRQCVEKLIPQVTTGASIITIIDNNSTDNTKEYVNSLKSGNLPVRYFFEPEQGLSHARNKGWQECNHEWIFYIDDDCVPESDVIRNALVCISLYADLAAIGGPIHPVFSGSPPSWLPDGFGRFEMPFDEFTNIDTGYIRGGCLLVQKKILNEIGGFKTYLGVKGNTLAYGEEIELQDRLRRFGYKIGYAPILKMGHHVRIEKINPGWILLAEYARRRDKMLIDPIQPVGAVAGFLRTFGGRIIRIPLYLFIAMLKKDYTLNHALLDILKPLMYRSGELAGIIKNYLK